MSSTAAAPSPADARAEPLLVSALGTSLTAPGAWLESLSAALEPLLNRPVRTLNFARVGATSRWGLRIVDQVSQARPDIAIVEFASNDAALHRHVPLGESRANITQIIHALKGASSKTRVYLMTMSPLIGLRGLLRPRLARYYELYPVLAAGERVGFIDNRPAWKALSRAELRRALPDGSHPTREFALSITLANVVRAIVHDLTIADAGAPGITANFHRAARASGFPS